MASILVIDDDPVIFALFRLMLEQAGHTVRSARNGNEGLQAQRAQPVDVILCDLFMPEKDGLQTIQELRAEFPGARVIAVSGSGDLLENEDLLRTAHQVGAQVVLGKPVAREQLLAAVRTVLQG